VSRSISSPQQRLTGLHGRAPLLPGPPGNLIDMFRQHIVVQNASALRARGRRLGSVQQLSPRLCRGTFGYSSRAFLTDIWRTNILQHVFSYPWLLPVSASQRPISLTSDIPRIRTYASHRRVPPSPPVRKEPTIILPDVPEPKQQLTNPEDFAPKWEIKYIERGFLAVFVVLYVLYETSRASLIRKHKKELEEQTKEITSQGGEKLQTNITLRMGGPQEPLAETRIVRVANGGSTDGAPTTEPDSSIQELELNLSEPGKLFLFIQKNFQFSPARIFPVDESGFEFRPWTAVTSSLLHEHILHLFACYFSLKVFTSPLILLYGTRRFLGLFFAGAGLATTLYAGAERVINPIAGMTLEQRQKALSDRNADHKERGAALRYFGPSVGSSGALVALGM